MNRQSEPLAHSPTTPRGQGASIVLRAQGVGVSYRGRVAVEGVNLSMVERRITALVGPSGCGKTSFLTSLNRLSDLIGGCRVDGSVFFHDRDIMAPECDVVGLRRRVGMIFQRPNPFPLSVRRNLAFPLREHGVRDRAEVERIVESSLRDVGLWEEVKDRLDGSALALSGGQQQRLCIARALALAPEVLLMDEPCSALDPLSSGVVEDLILRLRERYTVLIVTHNLAQARRVADDVALFWAQGGPGRLVEFGSTQQFFGSPQHPLTQAYVDGLRG
jgi:phosphate transport system ATP-binding protein